MTTTYKPTGVKSVHIKECWPYQYVASERPSQNRKAYTREAAERANARKREVYHAKKKLMQLQVFELDIDFCRGLNNATTKSSK